MDIVLTDLAKISDSLEKLKKIGCSLAKVTTALGKLVWRVSLLSLYKMLIWYTRLVVTSTRINYEVS